jgi:hypothetical protein
MSGIYANSAKKFCLEKSLEKAERMFNDQIRESNLGKGEVNVPSSPIAVTEQA